MEIIKRSGQAYAEFQPSTKKVDEFPCNGKIGKITFSAKSNDMGNCMKMVVGNIILTDIDLINNNTPNQQPKRLEFIPKNPLEFFKGNSFEFYQPSDNVSEIVIWFTQLETE